MRAAIETSALYTSRAGVARYIRGLLGGLQHLAEARTWQFEPFAWEVENFGFRQPQRAWRTFYRELLWAPFLAPRRLRPGSFDLFHSTCTPLFNVPTGVPHVTTVHDAAMIRHPERFRGWHRRMGLRALERARKADRILCISEFTARELVDAAGFDRARIRVVLNGGSLDDLHTPEAPPGCPLPDEFFLFVGSLEPGKNLALLRQTYDLAQHNGHTLPALAIVGARIPGVTAEGPPPASWHYLGPLPDPELAWLYRRARALLFPSKYEGFGLPILEAMSLGCPVLCSPVASLPEVAGDAALTIPLNPASYLDAMKRILDEVGLREELVGRGRQHARHFTWERCARETFEVYQEARGR